MRATPRGEGPIRHDPINSFGPQKLPFVFVNQHNSTDDEAAPAFSLQPIEPNSLFHHLDRIARSIGQERSLRLLDDFNTVEPRSNIHRPRILEENINAHRRFCQFPTPQQQQPVARLE